MNTMMKKVFVFALFAAALMLSCAKEIEQPLEKDEIVPEGYYRLRLSATSESTKTDLSGGSTVWSEGDKIKVICSDGSELDPFTLVSGAGTSSAVFRGLAPTGKKAAYAVYPVSAFVSVSGSTVSVGIPDTQEGSFAAGNVAVAKVASDNSMSFKNVNAFLAFQLEEGTDVTRVEVTSVGGGALSGTVPVDCSGAAPAPGKPSGTASKITMTTSGAGVYYMSAVPSNHSAGLKMTWFAGETEKGGYYLDRNLDIVAGHMYTIGEFGTEGDYYVTVDGAGRKSGMDWANAMSAAQMWARLDVSAETDEAKAAKIAAIDGATFHMAAGDYDFGDDPSISFDETENISLTLKGGYNAATGVRNFDSYATNITGADSHACLKVTGTVDITLDGVNIVHGNVTGTPEAALSCRGSSLHLTMIDCKVTDNVNPGSGGSNAGAGLNLYQTKTFRATRVTFAHNTSNHAPAIFCRGTYMVLNECVFDSNRATSWGGAVRIRVGTPVCTFSNCIFTGNSASGDSGCIVHNNGTLTIDGCTFTGNTSAGNGGAITMNGTGTLNIKGGSEFSANQAKYGGAIFTLSSTNADHTNEINISGNCTFSGNHATGWAGAIHFKCPGSLNVTDCTFSGNYGDGDSGAFNADNANATFTFNEVTFSGNHSDSDNGGVMWLSDGTYSFSNCQFLNNYASGNGGAIYSEKAGDVSITGCTFEGNHTTCRQNNDDGKNGGALYFHGAPTVKIKASQFNDNYAGIGGAIFTNKDGDNYPTVFLNACSFSGNYVQYRYGAAINIDHASYFCMNNRSFANNHYVNLTSGGDGLKASWIALDGIQNCSVISNCSLIGRTWRCNNDDLEKTLTNNALIGLWDAKSTYLINDLILIDTNGNSFSPLRGYNETPLQAVTAYYTHYSKDNINIDWSGDHNVKGYWREHTRYGNGSDDATWDEDCWKWSGYYVKDGNTIDGYDKITKSDFTGYLNAACPAFVTWLGSDIDKDQLGNYRGAAGWLPGAFQNQTGAEDKLINVITWNIRSSEMEEDTGDRAWSARRGGMAAFINDRKPHIVCMQECESDQRSYLTSNCSGYSAIYDNTSLSWWQQLTGAERSAEVILYKSSAISVQSSGTFWLVSGAPTSPSKSSDQNSYRSCTWMKCTYNGQKMLVMDVHLSYRTKKNSTPQSDDVIALRQREMAVIKTWIDGHYNPATDGWLLFMGDMNTTHWEAIFDEWKDGTYGYFSRDACPGAATGRTYNDWDWENGHVSTIDFQFYKGFPSVKSYIQRS